MLTRPNVWWEAIKSLQEVFRSKLIRTILFLPEKKNDSHYSNSKSFRINLFERKPIVYHCLQPFIAKFAWGVVYTQRNCMKLKFSILTANFDIIFGFTGTITIPSPRKILHLIVSEHLLKSFNSKLCPIYYFAVMINEQTISNFKKEGGGGGAGAGAGTNLNKNL